MSADNWETCPTCYGNAFDAASLLRKHIDESYGVIPAEEFKKADAMFKLPDPEDFRSFREDYEIFGADEGTINVSYSGHCSTCGATAKFLTTHPVTPGRKD